METKINPEGPRVSFAQRIKDFTSSGLNREIELDPCLENKLKMDIESDRARLKARAEANPKKRRFLGISF
jgi:hypothetical protein